MKTDAALCYLSTNLCAINLPECNIFTFTAVRATNLRYCVILYAQISEIQSHAFVFRKARIQKR